MIYVDGPHKIARRRSRMLVSEPFRLEKPEGGLDAEYLRRQTGLLEEKMKTMTAEFSDFE